MTEYNTEQKSVFTRRQIIKNLSVISFGFLFLFIAYCGLSMLQSTMNQHQGVGVASQAIIYAAFCTSSLFLPKYALKKLGCKRAMFLSMCGYVPYLAANFYFNWFTAVPSALMGGLSASLLWSSQCTYFNEASSIYCILTIKEKREKQKSLNSEVPGRYCHRNKNKNMNMHHKKEGNSEILGVNGIQNHACAKFSISATDPGYESFKKLDMDTKDKNINDFSKSVLRIADSKESVSSYLEQNDLKISQGLAIIDSEEYSKMISSVTAVSFGLFGLLFRTSDVWSNVMSYYILNNHAILDNITETGNCSCGASFCNVESHCFEHNLAEPNQQMRNLLSGVSVGLGFLGILLVLLLLDELETKKEPVKLSLNFVMATYKFLRKKEAMLLVPLSAYIGFQQTFYIADFTKSYIACSWGVYHVGLVSLCYGAAAGIASTVSGVMVKYIGRIPVMLLAAFINSATILFLLIWNPVPGHPLELFISAGMWGTSLGTLWSQVRAFYGVIFKKDEEAAFAGFFLCESIGSCMAFSYSNHICTYVKLYILLTVSSIGVIGYLKTEMMHRKKSKKSEPD